MYESRLYESTSGVVTGTILGPTTFLIYIYDIVDCVIMTMVLMFAVEWSESNRLPFNKEKLTETEFHNASYMMGDHEIKRKEEIRDLILVVDQRITLAAHMEQMMKSSRTLVQEH